MYILKLSYEKNDVRRSGEFFSGFGMAYHTDYEIFEPVLETQVNSVGHFSFTIYPTHPLYEFIDQPKALLEVVRYGFNEPLFIGRMAQCQTGLYNEKIITFESELAFLLDSVRTNFSSNADDSGSGWLKRILEYHNSRADNFGTVYTTNIQRKFQAGRVSEAFSSSMVRPSAEEFKGTFSTLEIISKLLLEKYGGVLKLRHENGINYIDWLDENDLHTASQKIELAKNLISIENSYTADELVTAIRPVGDNVSTDGGESVPLDLMLQDASVFISDDDIQQVIDPTVSAMSDLRFTDTLYSYSLVKKYGWIQREVTFSGVNHWTVLVKKAVEYLQSMSASESITVSAVDLASGNNSIENFITGDFAVINSPVHFFENRKMLINSVRLNLADSTASELTLGSEGVSITSQLGRSGNVSFSGGLSGSGGRYDPEGSAASALTAAKNYTDSVSALKVDKQDGKGLSANDFTDSCKEQIDTNASDISALKTKTDATDVNVANLLAELAKKASSDDVYTKPQTDELIISKVAEIVAGAPADFDTLKEMSDWITNHADSAADMNTAITQNAKDISDLEEKTDAANTVVGNLSTNLQNAFTQIAAKLDKASREYVPIRYISGNKNFNTDFQLTSEDSNKVVFSNSESGSMSENAPFSTTEYYPYLLTVEKIYAGSTTSTCDLRQTCIFVKHSGTENAQLCEYQRFYKGGVNPLWADWKECGQTADELLLEKIVENQYNTAVNTMTLGYQKSKNLLKNMATTENINGVTFTVNANKSVTVNGTAEALINYTINSKTTLPAGSYILTGGASGGSISTYLMQMNDAAVTKTFREVYTDTDIRTHTFSETTDISMRIVIYPGVAVENVTFYPMVRSADISDETYEPYVESVDERFNKFTSQSLLYSDTTGGSSPQTVTIPGVFTKYSAVILNAATSTGTCHCVLPLQYIRTLGTDGYYAADNLLFYYVDDSNLTIRTGLGQSNPTIGNVEIIGLY